MPVNQTPPDDLKEALAWADEEDEVMSDMREWEVKNAKVLARAVRSLEAERDEMRKERDNYKKAWEKLHDGNVVPCVDKINGCEFPAPAASREVE